MARISTTTKEQIERGQGAGQCGCKDQLADCWKHQDKDAGGWTRKAPLPVEWSRDKGMNLRARYEAKPRQESLARGKNGTASCLRSPICSPVREVSCPIRSLPQVSLMPLLVHAGCSSVSCFMPSFMRHRVLSPVMNEEIEAQRGLVTCLLSHSS